MDGQTDSQTTAEKWAAFFAHQKADFNKAMGRDEEGREL
tara:strand:+ start:543 stop:659 length:117 start_codon:yes stop_codon:yes gene_type:complete